MIIAGNLRDNCSVKMVFLPKFSLLSLSQPANTKQGEQYKNYKIFTHIQTLHDNGYKSTKITVWKS